jgi:TLD
MKSAEKSDESNTFAPSYDIILDEKQKSKLQQVKMSKTLNDKIKGSTAISTLANKQTQENSQTKEAITQPLIKFIPRQNGRSEILTDLQISNLVECFPSMMMTMDWNLVYSINRDGDSMGTFFEKCKDWKYTLIVVKEKNGWTFGGFCSEKWRSAIKFYGTGESFLFTFKDGSQPTVYYWSGEND